MKPEDFGTVESMGNMGEAMDWEDEIEKESEFVLLEPGEYEFKVAGFERQRFDGSEKMAPCPVAKLTLEVNAERGTASIFDRLFLNSKAEWKLSAFFGSIGQKKHGEKLRMNWQQVVGAKGHAKIKQREYNGKTYNEVDSYIYAEDVVPPAKAWKAGGF